MNEKMLNKIKNSGSELDLSDLFWHVVSKWRILLVCGLILGILLGGLSAFDSFSDLNDESYVSSSRESNAIKHNLFIVNLNQYESRIDFLTGEILRQKDYAAHSALLALDPYKVYVYEGLYHVEAQTEAAEDPAQTQAPNHTKAVISAYAAQIRNLDEGAVLAAADQLLADPALDNYEGFLFVKEDASAASLRYKAYGATPEQAEALAEAVKATIRDSEAAIRASVCEHSIAAVSENLSLGSDEDLKAQHVDFDNNMANYAAGLDQAITKRDKLAYPSLVNLSRTDAVKAAVKKAALGFGAGLVLAAVYFAVCFITKGIVADPDDVMNRYGIGVLGVIPSGKRRGGLDGLIARHFGLPRGVSEQDGLRYAGLNLEEAAKGSKSLLVTGSGDAAAIGALCEKLGEQAPGLQLRAAGNILYDPEARKAFGESDAVVFVETLQQARHADLRRELIRTLEAEKKCLGFLLTEKA